MKILLELLRILLLFGILGGLGWVIIEQLYKFDEGAKNYSIFGAVAILLLFFVLYRNKLQFTGWYKGHGRVKLPRKVTAVLLSVSFILIFLPFLAGFFY